jgi:alkylation response protein AidB-like acyl-CoA dehydrogenase
MGAYLPERGQAELWAAGPDTLIAGALIPGGAVTRTDNGWTVTGAWGFTSGVEDADWALVGGPMTGEATRFFAVPRGDFSVSDTWSTVGMRGTGSNTLVLDGVYVPEHRSFLREEMLQGRPVGSSAACHSIPLRAVNGLSFAAPVLGAARGALGGRAGAEVFARSAGEIDAAELLLRRAASVADSGAVDPRLVARGIRDCALAADFLVIAVERLFRAAGSRAHAETDRIQRAWRDVHTASSHVVLQFEPAAAAYAGQFLTSK